MKRAILILIAVLALAGAGFVYTRFRAAQQSQSALASFETAPLETGSLTTTISATGKVRASQSATLYWQTSGTVEKVAVQVGDQVKAGDVLATLAQASLPQNVILAQADLASAQQALADLATQAEISKAAAMQAIVTYEQAVKDAQYQLDLFTVPSNQANMGEVEALNVMKERLDQARAAFEPVKFRPSTDALRQERKEALDVAQADYNAAVKRLQYVYDLEVAQANLDKAWQDYNKWKDGPLQADVAAAQAKVTAIESTLRQAWIEAPFAGTITQVAPQVGDQVSPNNLAFRLDDLSTLYLDLQVSEVDINLIKPGQEALITFDALRQRSYHGQVSQVAMVASESTGVVTYLVTVVLSDPDPAVRPGMTAEVDIAVAQKSGILLIPNQALRVEDGAQVVYVIKPGQGMLPVNVTLGISSDTHSELVAGDLQEGDQIVLNPSQVNLNQRPRLLFGGPPGGGEGEPGGEGTFNERTPSGGQP